jgi:hypothetical protein
MVSVRNAPTAEEILADMKKEDESLPPFATTKIGKVELGYTGSYAQGLLSFTFTEKGM